MTDTLLLSLSLFLHCSILYLYFKSSTSKQRIHISIEKDVLFPNKTAFMSVPYWTAMHEKHMHVILTVLRQALSHLQEGRKRAMTGFPKRNIRQHTAIIYVTQSNGRCTREAKKRAQAVWSGWRWVSAVICDRRVADWRGRFTRW